MLFDEVGVPSANLMPLMVVEPVMLSAPLLTIEPPFIATTSAPVTNVVAATVSEPPEIVSVVPLLIVTLAAA